MDEEEYIPTRLDWIHYYYYKHEKTILEIIAFITIIIGLIVIGILLTTLMAILTLTIGWITKWVYRRALSMLANIEISRMPGSSINTVPTIREMHDLIDYIRHVNRTGGELDEDNPLLKKKKMNGEDVAYQ